MRICLVNALVGVVGHGAVAVTRKRKDGRTEWIPPPNLDTGQTRVNNYHHPHRYLTPDENDESAREGDDGDSGEDDSP